MRDILNKLEVLTESTGLANRKSGDVFRNSADEEITFDSIRFFPEEGGRYDAKQLDHMVLDVNGQTDNSIQWLNNRTGKTGGFALATFTGPEGELYFGRYLDNVKADPKDNYVPNQIGDYQFKGKSAAKAQAGLGPQDLLSNKIDLSADDILEQLATSLGTDSPLYSLTYKLVQGEPLPMTFPAPVGVSFSAFRDYFCEIIQPIALQKGQYTGNAGEAAETFLDGSFENTLISFDEAKTAGLSDSIITNAEGKYIKVSTKGGQGATASAKNLVSSVDELSQSPNGKNLLEKYSEVIEMLREVQSQGQVGAPLYLGVKYGIIDDSDAEEIKKLKNVGPIPMDKLNTLGLSSNLEKLAHARKTENLDKVNLYYHLIAAVAHKAAQEVNDKTDFSKAAADILNNGALVQVYTKAKESRGSWTLDEFKTLYPSESIAGVYFSAGKTYYSTGIKGNFTFKIDKGEGKPKDEDEGPGREKRTPPTEKAFTKKAADLALGRERPEIRSIDRNPTTTGGVGREKR